MRLTPMPGRGPRGRLLAVIVMIAGLAGLMGLPVMASPASASTAGRAAARPHPHRHPSRAAARQSPPRVTLGWGANGFGQLGDGATGTISTTPVRTALPEGVTFTQVAGGALHTLGRASDGRVFAWGDNTYGQLGDGTTTASPTPVETRLPAGVTIKQVAAANYYSLAVATDGRVFAWGNNFYGQLGDGTTFNRDTPVEVHLPAGVTIEQVACNSYFSFALSTDGHVYAWGWNAAGMLGDGTTTDRHTPVRTLIPEGVTITQIAAGESHGLGRASDGRVYAWGANYKGEIGDGGDPTQFHLTPVTVALPQGVSITNVAAGLRFSLGVASDGRVFGWGSNVFGQVGDGGTTDRYTPVQTDIPAGVTIIRVAAGADHGLGLASDGRVYSWGGNHSGQLGDGTRTNRLTPAEVALPGDVVKVTAIGTGVSYSLVVAETRESATTLKAEPAKAAEGRTVTLTAHVTCTGRTPNGAVTFSDGRRGLGTATVRDGVAALTVRTLAVGRHTITAHYNGNADCPPSSGSTTVVIQRAHQPRRPIVPVTG
ncbi:Ig-like domain repeat protein [Spirillospora sp. NPDC052269]